MADSIALYCPVQGSGELNEQLPYSAQIDIDQDGVLGHVRGRPVVVRSPFNEAKFKLRASLGQDRRVRGYLVEVNAPTCMVGHNLLLANSAYRSSRAAFELLVRWLSDSGLPEQAVGLCAFGAVKIVSVTPTFLMPCGSHDDATRVLADFENHAAAVLNETGKPASAGKAPPVYSVGTGGIRTVYIKQREFKITAYVKGDVVPSGAYREFHSSGVEKLLLAEAKTYVRIEVELFEKWLTQNLLSSPDSWLIWRDGMCTGTDRYASVFQLIRKVLRLDQNLRHRSPRLDDLSRLADSDKALVQDHLRGENLRAHHSIVEKGGRLQQQKYFSALRNRILKGLRIDIDMPWSVQSRHVSPELPKLLHYPGMYEPPETLEPHVFCRENTMLMSRTSSGGRGLDEEVGRISST